MRRAVLALARVAAGSLVMFCIVDDHLHLVLVGSRARAGRLGRAISLALRPLAAGPMQPAFRRPVVERHHLETLVDYALGQPVRHGLPGHPALWTGSSYLDLVGARYLPGLELRLREVLPRLTRGRLHASVGIGREPVRPASLADIRRLGAYALPAAAAAALAAPDGLGGNERPARTARLAVVRLGRTAGIRPSEIADAIGIRPRSARKLAHRPVDARAVHAIRLRLALEARVAGLGPVRSPRESGHPMSPDR
jgi:hypothetical protein